MALVLKLAVVYGAVLVNFIPAQGKICVVEYKRLIMYSVVTFKQKHIAVPIFFINFVNPKPKKELQLKKK